MEWRQHKVKDVPGSRSRCSERVIRPSSSSVSWLLDALGRGLVRGSLVLFLPFLCRYCAAMHVRAVKAQQQSLKAESCTRASAAPRGGTQRRQGLHGRAETVAGGRLTEREVQELWILESVAAGGFFRLRSRAAARRSRSPACRHQLWSGRGWSCGHSVCLRGRRSGAQGRNVAAMFSSRPGARQRVRRRRCRRAGGGWLVAVHDSPGAQIAVPPW